MNVGQRSEPLFFHDVKSFLFCSIHSRNSILPVLSQSTESTGQYAKMFLLN